MEVSKTAVGIVAGLCIGAGAGGAFLTKSLWATSHSLHMNLPVFWPASLICATACSLHSGCSQFAQCVTAAWPLNPRDSLKFFAGTGVSTRTCTDFDTSSVAWQRRWGGGR